MSCCLKLAWTEDALPKRKVISREITTADLGPTPPTIHSSKVAPIQKMPHATFRIRRIALLVIYSVYSHSRGTLSKIASALETTLSELLKGL
jgi:hypothetical protein